MNTGTRSALLLAAVLGAMTAGGCAGGAGGGAGSGGASRSAVVVNDDPIEASSATLVVHGMSCPLCANNVDKQLMEVRGVRDVKVDMSSGEVSVALADADRPSTAELKRAVDGSGFTLVSIRVP